MDELIIKRLAFAKYIFCLGKSQSLQPEPLCGLSILSFHDSVELFLQLALDQLGVGKKVEHFMDYWEIVASGKGIELSQKESMRKLNNARVSLKHFGSAPSTMDIEYFRVMTEAFFNENSPLIFGSQFKDVSLIDLIKCESARGALRKARSGFESADICQALQDLAVAFEYLIRSYEETKRDENFRSPFFFGKSMAFLSSFHLDLPDEWDKVKEFVDRTVETLDEMQEALKLIAIGIDFRKYAKFKAIVPHVYMTGGEPSSQFVNEPSLGKEDYEFCETFIIESALKLQEFDYRYLEENELPAENS